MESSLGGSKLLIVGGEGEEGGREGAKLNFKKLKWMGGSRLPIVEEGRERGGASLVRRWGWGGDGALQEERRC